MGNPYKLVGTVIASVDAAMRGHLPGCPCARCLASRVAIEGVAGAVERAQTARDARRAKPSQGGGFIAIGDFGSAVEGRELARGEPELVEAEVITETHPTLSRRGAGR